MRLVYIGSKGDKLGDIAGREKLFDEVFAIRAGKFRRYHGQGIKQVFDVMTLLKNIRDALYVLIGLWQSYWLLGRIRPSAIFIKGGFVGVPVGLAAKFRNIPYLTHDSDVLPGLANRIVGRWAKLHAVSMPKELYAYPAEKTVFVGVPVGKEYTPVSHDRQAAYRKELGIAAEGQVVFVTGGGLGAQRLNNALIAIVPKLLHTHPRLTLLHAVGRDNEVTVQKQYRLVLPENEQGRVIIKGFVHDLYRYSGAADVIVARAGATAIAEFAAQGKTCILVPNPLLTGGHQLKNAQAIEQTGGAVVITEQQLEEKPDSLADAINSLLVNDSKRKDLARNLSTHAKLDAAHLLAELLLSLSKDESKKDTS